MTSHKVPARWTGDRVLAPMQRTMNDMFADFFRGFPMAMSSELIPEADRLFAPRLDLSEDDKEVTITCELPGVDEKDVSVFFRENMLTIKGEKKAEREEKKQDYWRTERYFGSFMRTVELPAAVDTDKTSAKFKNGVLTVRAPKTAEARKYEKRIPITS